MSRVREITRMAARVRPSSRHCCRWIVIGATIAAQLWQATSDVGVGFVIAGISMVCCGLALLAHPRDVPAD